MRRLVNRSKTLLWATVLVAVVLLATGCASMQTTDWNGHHIDEVIKKFGTPTRVLPAADGGKMYVWETERSVANPAWSGGGSVSAQEQRWKTVRTFWVRPDGIISTFNIQD